MRHVGVDGCPSASIGALVTAFADAERILIDIPIGLPWQDAPVRACDRLARQILGRPRGSSVFSVPCREALCMNQLERARRVNLNQIGRSIGVQTWAISPK